jgi:cytochrome c oxidase subunit 3
MNSIVLFGSGVTMHFALENWKHLNRAKFFAWLLATIALGLGFLAGQYHEYSTVGISWSGSVMGASFFTLTGLHGFHVSVGVLYLTILGLQAKRGVYTGSKYFGLTAGTLYWHFVDAIWVILFSIFYIW